VKISEVMSSEVPHCFEDDAAEDVARRMDELRVTRLPVLDRDGRLVGMVSLSDLPASGDRGGGAKASKRAPAADERQTTLQFAGGKPATQPPERSAKASRTGSGMEPDDLKKGGF
jgi:CBS-domain-containing membrane protein